MGGNKERNMAENKVKYECYCCHKEITEIEDFSFITATMSGKCKDGTHAERRVVCKECNHIKG